MKYTAERIENLRKQWAEAHPEEAQRRAKKKSFERIEDENVFDPPILSEKASLEVKKEMMALWKYLYDRRHSFLEHRNLELAELDHETKLKFKKFVIIYDGISGFSLEVENLLIDGLKYPEKDNELANFCFNYLEQKYAKGAEPSMSLWIQLWNRDFVPLDAVRLMIKHDATSGTYHKVQKFVPLFPLLKNKIKKHLVKEEERLEQAKQMPKDQRAFVCGRRSRRLFYFNILLHAFE